MRVMLTLIFSSLFLTAPTYANESSPRLLLGANLALVNADTSPVNIPNLPKNMGRMFDGFDIEYDAGHGILLVLGYGQKVGVRGEFEVGYRMMPIDNIRNIRLAGSTEPLQGELGVKGDISSLSIMGNLVSSMRVGIFDFYLGGGIGLARVEAALDARPIAMVDLSDVDRDSQDDVFAWQIFAGLQYEIADDLTAKAGYRYFATKDGDFDGSTASVRSHNFEIGLLYWLN